MVKKFEFKDCDDADDFGTLLADARTKRGVSQGWLAKKIFVTDATISRWENHSYSKSLTIEQILSIAIHLQIGSIPFDRNHPEVVRFVRAGACSRLHAVLVDGGFIDG
jgi:DNA-binding XRE family transcriptional regulator